MLEFFGSVYSLTVDRFFPIAPLVGFSMGFGVISRGFSLLRDFDREFLRVETGMVLIDILGLISCCFVQIVPEVNFFTKNYFY